MADFGVDPAALSGLAGEVSSLAKAFEGAEPPALGEHGMAGRASVEAAYGQFVSVWTREVDAVHAQIERLSTIVELAAQAYSGMDQSVAVAASASAGKAAGVGR